MTPRPKSRKSGPDDAPDALSLCLARARQGDPDAEQHLFHHLSVRFRLLTARRIRDPQAAEDVAQEACVTVLRKYREETFRVSFEAWAWGVVNMHIKNHLHRMSVRRERNVEERVRDREAASVVDPEVHRRLLDCLRKVSRVNRRYARILNLIHQGYSTDEICRRLEMNRNSLYVTLHRARNLLRRCLDSGDTQERDTRP